MSYVERVIMIFLVVDILITILQMFITVTLGKRFGNLK